MRVGIYRHVRARAIFGGHVASNLYHRRRNFMTRYAWVTDQRVLAAKGAEVRSAESDQPRLEKYFIGRRAWLLQLIDCGAPGLSNIKGLHDSLSPLHLKMIFSFVQRLAHAAPFQYSRNAGRKCHVAVQAVRIFMRKINQNLPFG